MDALIDPVRTVAEADVSVVVKQVAEAEWAVSLRSKGAVDVSRVAVALGGGGHRLAAGFTGHGTPGGRGRGRTRAAREVPDLTVARERPARGPVFLRP